MNNSRSEMEQRDHSAVARWGSGQAGAVTYGGFNGAHRGFGAGFQGVRGGSKYGRGYGGYPRQHRGGFNGFHPLYMGGTPTQNHHRVIEVRAGGMHG
jgi:hypothetical protein